MGERYSWAVGIDETEGVITVEDARLAMSAFWTPAGQIVSRSGVVPAASEPGRVTATTPTPNGFVHIAPFRAVLQSVRGGGTYNVCLDSVKDINILSTPADPSNPRIDLIVWQQSDTYFGDANSNFTVRHVVGAAAPVPVDPAVSGSTDYIIRARVTVPAGTTDIEQADIANVTLPWTVATGGLLPIRTQAERDAILLPYEGMPIYRTDRDWVEIYDGGAWRVHGVAICTSVADRNAAITHPRTGQLTMITDIDCLWQYDGATSAWVPIGGGVPQAQLRQTATQTLTTGVGAPINFQVEDRDNFAGHDNVTNNSRYTAQVPGWYELNGGIAFAASGVGARVSQWNKNGAMIDGSDLAFPSAGAGLATRIPARTTQVQLAAGDYVQLVGFQDSGGPLDTFTGGGVRSSMSVKFVGT
ncbi:hypothetical protein BBK82_04965 [Lentzea guizhouensis]|uniref:C1q domain-containing protein n=1 Tax=Lentzea guizhouensis TaxID=1586287 RepID=A0A1B2HCR5_9PSEU|nr:hypothetical protein [Lentzea guizhouensis]ANZ35527.1 hypothetical protein BBK82_04965 [Lentzea guizhouensis]